MASSGIILNIDPIWMKQILKYTGYPRIEEILLGEEEVKELCLFPAMVEYFSKWPIKVFEETRVNQTGTIPWPDDETFGVLEVRAVGKRGGTGGGTSDFLKILQHQKLSYGSVTKSTGRYGASRSNLAKKFSPEGLGFQAISNRQLYASLDELETFKHMVNRDARTIEVYVSSTANIMVCWAKYSKNFNQDVRHNHKLDVTKLAGAYLLEHLADLSAIMEDNNVEKKFNTDALKSRAEELKAQVIDVWKEIPTIAVFRGA